MSRVVFQPHEGGVIAHGVVRGVRQNDDGSHDVSIRHRPLRKSTPHGSNKAMPMDDYVPDTNVNVPDGCQDHFSVGQKVSVHVKPHGGKPKKGKISRTYAG